MNRDKQIMSPRMTIKTSSNDINLHHEVNEVVRNVGSIMTMHLWMWVKGRILSEVGKELDMAKNVKDALQKGNKKVEDALRRWVAAGANNRDAVQRVGYSIW